MKDRWMAGGRLSVDYRANGDTAIDIRMTKKEAHGVIDDLFESGAVKFTGLDGNGNEVSITLRVED